MEDLLRGLWPVIKPLATARLAQWIEERAKVNRIPLTPEQALALAVVAINLITELLDGRTAPPADAVEKARAALG